ncbi:hypothetical protein [Gimesia algae]|uniref:Uncharacterized protein n=1 Tax=Gimesia algae TaxID=2527971 RepID=A0A517VC67_9PLAN|nr:hypothetical protein [Gimesia algae]QDT90600.1 hypothetical protein Pan161_22530 [Gimesia algae]
MINELFEEEVRFNQASRPNWEQGATHRNLITGYLTDLADSSRGRLCVLGAGNCNDLDLQKLLQVYSEIHLVDLDESALRYAIDFQSVSDNPAISMHVLDLTGIGDRLAAFKSDPDQGEAELREIITALTGVQELNLPGPYDVVCSTCILSQLILQVVHAVGETHPQFEELMVAVREQHFRSVLDLIGEGGAGLIISDFVSSESAADLKDVPDFQFTQYLSQLLSSRNFFHGVHPGLLFAQLKGKAPLAKLVQDVEMLPPWRWDLGARQYAVAGLRFYLRMTE